MWKFLKNELEIFVPRKRGVSIFETDLMYDKRWRKKPKYGMLIVYLVLFALLLILAGHDWSAKETPTHNELTFLV